MGHDGNRVIRIRIGRGRPHKDTTEEVPVLFVGDIDGRAKSLYTPAAVRATGHAAPPRGYSNALAYGAAIVHLAVCERFGFDARTSPGARLDGSLYVTAGPVDAVSDGIRPMDGSAVCEAYLRVEGPVELRFRESEDAIGDARLADGLLALLADNAMREARLLGELE